MPLPAEEVRKVPDLTEETSPLSGDMLLLSRTGASRRITMANVLAWIAANINLSDYALLASPALTGTPTGPTAEPGTATTQLATTAFVDAVRTAILAVIDALAAGDVGADPAGSAAAAETAANSYAATLAADAETQAKAYADLLVAAALKLRGGYDASGNVWPSTGGTGAGGAIKEGNLWVVSVPGVLGGKQVVVGDAFFAVADTPGQTSANWCVLDTNLGFVPEEAGTAAAAITAHLLALDPHGDRAYADSVGSATLAAAQAAMQAYVGNQINAFGNVESQTYRWFEDFIALGDTATQKLSNLRCRSDAMTVSSTGSTFTNSTISGALHAMGWGYLYNTGSLGTGAVAAIQNYDGYSKVPVTASKELIFAGTLNVLPTNTSTTDCVHRIGMCGYGVGNAADPVGQALASAYFQADKDGFWKCFSGKTGANQNTTTGVATAENTYISLRIVIVATTGIVYFYINGTLVATHDGAGVVPYEQGWFRFIALYNQGAGTFPSVGGLGGRGSIYVDAWGQLIRSSEDRANLRFLT